MNKKHLKKLIIRIQFMEDDELKILDSSVRTSDASTEIKEIVLKAIRVRTHGDEDIKSALKPADGEYKLSEFN